MKKKQFSETISSAVKTKDERRKSPLRVGFPRSLLYYKFHVLWTVFFETLGAEVVVSPLTNKEIKDISVKSAPDEDCYSTKLYFGHVIYLKDKVDYFFIPRFSSDHKTDISCPKFIGLAEVLRSMFPYLPPILMPYYSKAKDGHGKIRLIIIAFSLGFKFTKNPFRILYSFAKSFRKYKQYHDDLYISEDELKRWEKDEFVFNKEITATNEMNPIKIALAGHSYVINDSYSSLSIKEMLLSENVEIITSEQLPRSVIEHQMSKLDFNMYFRYEREILGTIMHFLESETVDGILQLIIFSCGPDSIGGEMASRFSRRKQNVPLLQLTLDELTSEVGVRTRLEAFLDLIERRKKLKESEILCQ
ncbi:MAG: hypothetical protein KAJ72_06525 [Candidatus Heimdallarchaeota archaeon]|nr:hypothetical protein [Candidatus Heimdallarchaeota archaeon]